MEPTSADGTAFNEGLALDHLNPPDIEQFVRGLPRRLDETLRELDERAEADRVVELLTAIVDRLDELIDDVNAAGFAPDTRLEPALADWSKQQNRSPALRDARGRLDVASVEAARGLAGIPNNGWSTNDGLLTGARAAVGRIAPFLRTIEEEVAAANSRPDDSDNSDAGA